jgi:hypothetical protein
MTVRLEGGFIYDPVASTLTEVAAQSTGTITAPSSNPRIDRVVIDSSSGAVAVITGSEAASPTPPAITANKLPVAQVYLTPGMASEITNQIIYDERVGAIPASSAGGVELYTTPGTGIFTAKKTGAHLVTLAGGGGGGGGDDGAYGGGGGGGGGIEVRVLNLTKGTSYSYQVGQKGLGGADNNNGTNGTESYLKEGSTYLAQAGGGAGGIKGYGGNAAGGTITTVSEVLSRINGATGGIGYSGNDASYPGQGGSCLMAGGNIGTGGAKNNAGTGYGAGGGGSIGGAGSNAGKDGTPGFVRIVW